LGNRKDREEWLMAEACQNSRANIAKRHSG
jgi:hypothetical protein